MKLIPYLNQFIEALLIYLYDFYSNLYLLIADRKTYKIVKLSMKELKARGFRFAGVFWHNGRLSFTGFPLAKSAISFFIYYLLKQEKHGSVVELGGGGSTVFWNIFLKKIKGLSFLSLEHDKDWYDKVLNEVSLSDNFKVIHARLRSFTDETREKIFKNFKNGKNIYLSESSVIPENLNQDRETSPHNYFYDLNGVSGLKSLDGLILDGPFGNGRSMAFPVLSSYIHPGTIILIDDFNHYPFLDDLQRVFKIEILKKFNQPFGNKRWLVVKVI